MKLNKMGKFYRYLI